MSLRRPSAATVLASLALFVALGGVSAAQDAATSAAKKISGSTIKDRSITAADRQQHAHRHADQERLDRRGRARRGAHRQASPTVGAAGPKGDKGDTGAPGPNVVPADGVTAAGVKDGSLSARDVGRYATTLNDLDFGPSTTARARRSRRPA